MKVVLSIFLCCFINYYFSQRLNDEIEFKNLSKDDSLRIENIKSLIPKSKIILKAECNRYALKRFGCIDDYKIVYLYENEPILFDEKYFNIIHEMKSNGSENDNMYILKNRTFITDWKNKKFISKTISINKDGIKYYNNYYVSKVDIEEIINSK